MIYQNHKLFIAISVGTSICCTPSVGVALNMWLTTNGMCAKNNTHIYIYMWHEQAIIEWSWRGSSADINVWTIERNNKSLRSTVVKVKTTPTFQPTDSGLSSGQMATRAGEHWNPLNACEAPLLESPFALMKACCQLAETLVSFLLLQQLSEDFYYYLSCWLVLQHIDWT